MPVYWPNQARTIAGHNLNLRMRTRAFLAGTQSEPGQYYLSQQVSHMAGHFLGHNLEKFYCFVL